MRVSEFPSIRPSRNIGLLKTRKCWSQLSIGSYGSKAFFRPCHVIGIPCMCVVHSFSYLFIFMLLFLFVILINVLLGTIQFMNVADLCPGVVARALNITYY